MHISPLHVYPEGRFRPLMCEHEGKWQVWCHAGALEILRQGKFKAWLELNPTKQYQVEFASGARANINPGDELWELLAEISRTFAVEVYETRFGLLWLPWTGQAKDLRQFSCIRISPKPVSGNAS